MVKSTPDVFPNVNQFYMAGLMSTPMVIKKAALKVKEIAEINGLITMYIGSDAG